MSIEKLYADKWQSSSKFFFDNDYYSQMAEIVKPYKTVLELGCGVGYSALSLVYDGHKVISVEKNHECVLMAKDLIRVNGHESEVNILEGDIVDESSRNSIISDIKADVVICWNPGTHLDKDSLLHYVPFMLKYGLTLDQIKEDPASSYTEMILWHACKMAKAMGAPIHIIDRCDVVDENTVDYFQTLGSETGFSQFQIGTMQAETISDGGVPLLSQGVLINVKKMPVIFASVLFK